MWSILTWEWPTSKLNWTWIKLLLACDLFLIFVSYTFITKYHYPLLLNICSSLNLLVVFVYICIVDANLVAIAFLISLSSIFDKIDFIYS